MSVRKQCYLFSAKTWNEVACSYKSFRISPDRQGVSQTAFSEAVFVFLKPPSARVYFYIAHLFLNETLIMNNKETFSSSRAMW